MNYTEVVGQEDTKHRLKQMVLNNRVPHAILLKGTPGSGALPLALAFASHLLCSNKTEEGPCGKCKACVQTTQLVHPDLHLVFPIALSTEIRKSEFWIKNFRQRVISNPYMDLDDWFTEISAENKLPVIGTDEANNIIRQLSYTSYEGVYKILLMWLPEKMNADASNKILKVLEEPGERTVFLLVSEQPDQLLPTILSRLQQIALARLQDVNIRNYLIENYSLEETTARQFTYLADGNMREAIRQCEIEDEEQEVDLAEHFQSFMRFAFSYDYPKILPWVENNAGFGREMHKRFFLYGLRMFRDCLMYNYGKKELVKLEDSELQFLQKFAPFVNRQNYEKLIEEFNSGYYHIERYANPKVLFMDLFGRCNVLIAPQKRS